MFFELSEQRLKFISFKSIFFEWFFEFVVGISKFEYFLFVLFGLFIDAFDLISMLFNQFDVVSGDLIVVIF